MLTAAIPAAEEKRLAALYRLDILDSPPLAQLDEVTRLACEEFNVAVSGVTLIDRHRQWFKSIHGYDIRETSREVAFCAHAILEEDCLVVEDLNKDPRFEFNPFVINEPHLRFYASCPIHDPTGFRIGTLCLFDVKPRTFDCTDRVKLVELARIVEERIALEYAY